MGSKWRVEDNRGGELPEEGWGWSGIDGSGLAEACTTIWCWNGGEPDQKTLTFFPFLGTFRWMCGLVGVDGIRISCNRVKTGRNE